MSQPDFTPQELYLIHYWKALERPGPNLTMWGYLLPAALVGCYALYQESAPLLFCALVLVCGFRIYDDSRQRVWTRVLRSIIAKYEAALRSAPPPDGLGT